MKSNSKNILFLYLKINFRLNSLDASKYSHVKKVILLSGKNKSGKDYIGRKLAENLPALVLHVNEPLKLEYEKIHAEDLSDCKDTYRKKMIKYVDYFVRRK